MSIVWFIDSVINKISSILENMGYGSSSEAISLVYLLLLLAIMVIIVLLFDTILYKIKR